MSKARWILRFVGICIVAFAAGIVTGFIKNDVRKPDAVATEEIKEEAQLVMEEEETLIYLPKKLRHYLVTSDGDYITLVEVFDDESKNVLETMQFNTSVLPKADVILLKQGMIFEDKDEALLMIENFVS